ncbi:hypothetical protein [Streptococcus salivarius]|uniref:hypothetical protein n=2 Tax=Streptococcus TaxID=1301 RepID=UPI0033992530
MICFALHWFGFYLESGCMSFKKLSHFTEFNAPLFLLHKELRFVSVANWIERSDTGANVEKGVKVGLLIYEDNSDYPDGATNLGEKLVVKVPFASIDDYSSFKPMVTVCKVVDVEKASVYGEYRNELSITAKVIEVDDIVEL